MLTTSGNRARGAETSPAHHDDSALAGGNGLAHLLRERRRLLRHRGLTQLANSTAPFASLRPGRRQRLADR